MSPDVQPVPEGYATLAPWIVTRGTAREIDCAESMRLAQETLDRELSARRA